jgi:FAD/FMN-containing dehydrogenase
MNLKKELVEIIGVNNVFDSPEILEKYATDDGINPPGAPTIAVKPRNTEEVSKIIAFANKNSLPGYYNPLSRRNSSGFI